MQINKNTKEKKKCFSPNSLWNTKWTSACTGSMRGSVQDISPGAPPGWTSPKSVQLSHVLLFWGLFDQRSGFVVVTTLVGFVLFHLSHVLWPSIALAWLSLQKRRQEFIRRRRQTANKQTCDHLHLHPVSASLQPYRSLGTHRLGASPPGLGDRRLKPLQGSLQVDCQWRKLYQGRGATFSLLLHHQWNHH